MNVFPKMPERSVELPLGCKNLMDVEAIRNWKPAVEQPWPWRAASDRLAYIEGQLADLLEAAGKSKLVSIWLHKVTVVADRDLNGSTILVQWRDAAEQESIRQVFEEGGIAATTEPLGRWKIKNGLKYTLPAEASSAARLIGEVLRNGYGLQMMAVIHLTCFEQKCA
jgi:hypothetical protein